MRNIINSFPKVGFLTNQLQLVTAQTEGKEGIGKMDTQIGTICILSFHAVIGRLRLAKGGIAITILNQLQPRLSVVFAVLG